MTLMFDLTQAIASAVAGATLVSPFVGRILDYYKEKDKVEKYPPEKDPGVISVTEIYNYYKKYGFKTQVMGASFRNSEEILELAGCDLLTIAPKFLEELTQAQGTVERKLSKEAAQKMSIEKIEVDEATFRWNLNENAMATDKLADGIRKFAADQLKLEKYILNRIATKAR